MPILLIKLGISSICAALKLVGERWWHNAQRYILPLVYGVGVSYLSHCWWAGLNVLPMIAGLVMGYKEYGNNDSVARAVWLFVITVLAGLGPVLTHHESWWAYIPICIASGFIGTWVRNINNLIGAPINGLTIVANIFFIHP